MTKKHHARIGIFGPSRSGKSSRLTKLEEISGGEIERGEKHKFRLIGEPLEDDGQKDGRLLGTEQDYRRLQTSGRVLFEYDNGLDTVHLVTKRDASDYRKYMTYLSDSYNGAEAFLRHFHNNLITFNLHTLPAIVDQRLRKQELNQEQRELRLEGYKRELALFLQNAHRFHFSILTWHPKKSDLYTISEDDQLQAEQDIMGDAKRMYSLVKTFEKYNPDGTLTVKQLHESFVDDQVRKLIGTSLSDLEAKLAYPTQIDLTPQLKSYQGFVPENMKDKLKEVKVIAYVHANGRHSLFLEGMIDPNEPQSDMNNIVYENIVLKLIEKRLGEPTAKKDISSRDISREISHYSNYGMVNIHNAWGRDGLLYSLGDHVPTNREHASLHIGFVYKNGKQPDISGYTLDEVISRNPWLPTITQRHEMTYNH